MATIAADPELMPDIRVFKVDVTDYYPEEFQRRAGKIFEVYLFDANLHVHCCELTPSYEMAFIGSTWTKSPRTERAREKLADDINISDLETSPVAYYHVRGINLEPLERLGPDKAQWARFLNDADGDRDEAREALVENYREYCCGNGYVG
jgi:hypothetical protein